MRTNRISPSSKRMASKAHRSVFGSSTAKSENRDILEKNDWLVACLECPKNLRPATNNFPPFTPLIHQPTPHVSQ